MDQCFQPVQRLSRLFYITVFCTTKPVSCLEIPSSDLRILQGLEITRTKGHESYFVSFRLN